jgi:hypothetical protein
MSSRFLQKTRIVLTMLSVQQLCVAQGISLASQPGAAQPGAAHPIATPNAAQHGESRNRAKNLKDLLVDLGKQHQVSILFEEETVKNIIITGADYRQEGSKLEKAADRPAQTIQSSFQKSGKRGLCDCAKV